jgi:hypothetical protein
MICKPLARPGHSRPALIGVNSITARFSLHAPMVRKPDISVLAGEFPQSVVSPACSSFDAHDDGRWYRFAQLVRGLKDQGDTRSLQVAFDRLEQYLKGEDPDLRDWATGFLQALQDVASWSSQDGEPFLRFMTPDMCGESETIRQDLADCSTRSRSLTWGVFTLHAPAPRAASPMPMGSGRISSKYQAG